MWYNRKIRNEERKTEIYKEIRKKKKERVRNRKERDYEREGSAQISPKVRFMK